MWSLAKKGRGQQNGAGEGSRRGETDEDDRGSLETPLIDLTKGLASRPVDQTRRPKGTEAATGERRSVKKSQNSKRGGGGLTLALALNLHPSVSDSVDLRVGSDDDLLSGKRVHGVPPEVLLERE